MAQGHQIMLQHLAGDDQTSQSDGLSVQSYWPERLSPCGEVFPDSTPHSTASTPTSYYSNSQLSLPLHTQAGSQAGASSHSSSHARGKEASFKLLVAFASDALINEMVLNSGWRRSSTGRSINNQILWKDKILESFNFACVTLNQDQTQLTNPIEKKMVQGLNSFRSKLAQKAESYARSYFKLETSTLDEALDLSKLQEIAQMITNPSDHTNFFLHKQGENGGIERIFGHPILESFHIDFWYNHDVSPVTKFRSSYSTTPARMLAFSGVALLCAIHRVSQGRCSNQPDPLQFSTKPYASNFNQYHEAIVKTIEDEYNGPTFREQLDSLNNQGMEKMRSSGRGSPELQPFVIPRAVMATAAAPPVAGPSSGPYADSSSAPWPSFQGDYGEYHDFQQ